MNNKSSNKLNSNRSNKNNKQLKEEIDYEDYYNSKFDDINEDYDSFNNHNNLTIDSSIKLSKNEGFGKNTKMSMQRMSNYNDDIDENEIDSNKDFVINNANISNAFNKKISNTTKNSNNFNNSSIPVNKSIKINITNNSVNFEEAKNNKDSLNISTGKISSTNNNTSGKTGNNRTFNRLKNKVKKEVSNEKNIANDNKANSLYKQGLIKNKYSDINNILERNDTENNDDDIQVNYEQTMADEVCANNNSKQDSHDNTAKFNSLVNYEATFGKSKNNNINNIEIPFIEDKFSPMITENQDTTKNLPKHIIQSIDMSKVSNEISKIKNIREYNDNSYNNSNSKNGNILISKNNNNELISDNDEDYNNEEEDDIDVELEGESKQILDFQRSLSSKYRLNVINKNRNNNNNNINKNANNNYLGKDNYINNMVNDIIYEKNEINDERNAISNSKNKKSPIIRSPVRNDNSNTSLIKSNVNKYNSTTSNNSRVKTFDINTNKDNLKGSAILLTNDNNSLINDNLLGNQVISNAKYRSNISSPNRNQSLNKNQSAVISNNYLSQQDYNQQSQINNQNDQLYLHQQQLLIKSPNKSTMNIENSQETLSEVDILKVEIAKYKKENLLLRQKVINLEEMSDYLELETENSSLKIKLAKKTKEVKEAQHKLNVSEEINTEYENTIKELKSKITSLTKDNTVKEEQIKELKREQRESNNSNEETMLLSKKIDRLIKESENQKDELINKTSKINELQDKIMTLEQERKEYSVKTNSEIMSLKEANMQNEKLKLSNLELSNNNELLDLKVHSLSDENKKLKHEIFIIKKDLDNEVFRNSGNSGYGNFEKFEGSLNSNTNTNSIGFRNDSIKEINNGNKRLSSSMFDENRNKKITNSKANPYMDDSYDEERDKLDDTKFNKGFNKFQGKNNNSNKNNANSTIMQQSDINNQYYKNNIKKNNQSQIFGNPTSSSSITNMNKANNNNNANNNFLLGHVEKKDPNIGSLGKETNLLAFNNQVQDNRTSYIESEISRLQSERQSVRNYLSLLSSLSFSL